MGADTVFADFRRTSAPGVRLKNNTVATIVRSSFRRNIVPYTENLAWVGIFGSAAAVYAGAALWLQVCSVLCCDIAPCLLLGGERRSVVG